MSAAKKSDKKTEKLTLIKAITQALDEEMEHDESVLVLGEDVGKNGGVFRATEGLQEKYGEERVFDTPLAEGGIVGTSFGLAIGGFKPVAEIQFMGFVYLAMNQLFAHAARIRNRSRGHYHCQMVLRMPYGGGIHAPEHHSESYEALFVHSPGIKVVMPSNPYDAKGLLIAAIRDEDPVVFLEPKRIYRSFREEVPKGLYEVPLGKAKIVEEGSDVTIITYGAMMQPVTEARESLQKENVSVEVLDLRTVSPLDTATIIESVEKTGRCVVVHEGPRTCGVGAEVVALINEKALLHLLAPVERVTGFDTIFPFAQLEKYYPPNKDRIVKAVKKTLEF